MDPQAPTAAELPIPEDMVLEVAGRKFRPSTETTFEQDLYIGGMLKEAGLVKMAAGFDMGKDEVSDVAMDIITTAFKSGKLFEILGAMMIEENVPWTIESAQKNAHFFSQIRSTAEKQKLHGVIVGVILAFFVSGAISSQTSMIYSGESASGSQPSDGSQPHPGAEGSEAQPTTDSGTSSSGS